MRPIGRVHARRCSASLTGMSRRGFTLVELLVAVAVVAILASVSAPSWRLWLARSALDAAAAQMLSGLALARRLALSTGSVTTLCLTNDLQHCTFAGREWMLFGNGGSGNHARRAGDEPVLRRYPLSRAVRVSGTRGYATYLPQLRAAMTLTFEFCHPALPRLRRTVIVSQTGRARLERADRAGATACGS